MSSLAGQPAATEDHDFSEAILHLNHEHADTVLFVGRTLGNLPDATAGALTGMDLAGICVQLTSSAGTVNVRLDYETPAPDPTESRDRMLALVIDARAQTGGDDLTSIERELVAGLIRAFVGQVTHCEQITPMIRQITVASESLADYKSVGPDDFVHVLLPPAGKHELTIDEGFSWQIHKGMAEEVRPRGAYYTVRKWRPEANELDLWFVLHGDDGACSAWASAAKPGDPIALWGPRTSFEPTANASKWLLLADETGLPALLSILESAPEGISVTAFIETANEDERVDVEQRPGHDVTWLGRDDRPAGNWRRAPCINQSL